MYDVLERKKFSNNRNTNSQVSLTFLAATLAKIWQVWCRIFEIAAVHPDKLCRKLKEETL